MSEIRQLNTGVGNFTLEDTDARSQISLINSKVIELSNKISEMDIDLDSYAKTSEIPTKVSQLNNDSNYLSSIPEEYVTDIELEAKGYLTEHQDLSNYATKDDINDKMSLPKNEEGDVDFGEEGKVLTSNGDGTFSWKKSSGGATILLGDVAGAEAKSSGAMTISIKWTDPNDAIIEGNIFATWAGTLVIRKKDSVPTSKDDGVIVLDSKVKNQYSSEYYTETFEEEGTYYYRFFPYSTDGNYTEGSSVNAKATHKPPLVSFSTGTDDEITDIINAYYNGILSLDEIKEVWTVGDTRTTSLSAMSATDVSESHSAQSVELVIIDFNHDDLVNPINGISKALLTLNLKNCLNTMGYMNGSNTNSGGWNGCARRTWCNNVFRNALPSYLKNLNKQTKKLSGTGGGSSSGTQTTNDYAFLLAEIEIFGKTTYSVSGEGSQYAYYKTSSNRIKNVGSSSEDWWERSPYSGDSYIFCLVYSGGNADDSYASNARGLAPCFCI